MSKEAYDDLVRWRRDREMNNKQYTKVNSQAKVQVASSNIKVGDIIEIKAHERIPADMILLHTTDPTGAVFIKTDQLDGETDWKLRKAVVYTHKLQNDHRLPTLDAVVTIERPHKSIYSFNGKFELLRTEERVEEGLGLENTLWANTTLASGGCVGLVIYTGKETRSVLNSNEPSNKLGITDYELNKLAMCLLALMLVVAFFTISMSGFSNHAGIVFFRYLLLLSSIIPISLRVNLDFAKIFYCYSISRDENSGFANPRNSTIPEELGRVHVLLSDKTGTLTQNDMVLKKISLESRSFGEDMHDFGQLAARNFISVREPIADSEDVTRRQRPEDMQARDMITALAVCHNVSTIFEDGKQEYQASSPDEMCLVEFTKNLDVVLAHRDQHNIVINTPGGDEHFEVLHLFPFTSERKRMGILVKHSQSEKIIFYMKGAETIIEPMLSSNTHADIMKEECENFAMEGLRTLAVCQKLLTPEEFARFDRSYKKAQASMSNREAEVTRVISALEENMNFLGVTGVEDKLQENVDSSIENLRAAGIKLWMLTGDKVETAQCIAVSTRIFKNRSHSWYKLINKKDLPELRASLNKLKGLQDPNQIVIIDGATLESVLENLELEFIESCMYSEAVVCCRASPTQKSRIVEAMKKHTNFRVCAIGDGGNDVGMIQSAHIGVGIEGKEGKQASLAADFSITGFQFVVPLFLWHGRLSYLRTSKLANFIFHRGLIIGVIQFTFFLLFYYSAIPVYNGYLMLGYSTVFTSMPVFSLVLDKDTDFETVKKNANLYQTLQLGRALNVLRFIFWVWQSIYQGSIIILLSMVLFPENSFVNLVAITFSSLILTELLNIATIVQTWNKLIVFFELATFCIYSASILLLKNYFNLDFIVTSDFFVKVLLITMAAWLPLHIASRVGQHYFPDEGSKLRGR